MVVNSEELSCVTLIWGWRASWRTEEKRWKFPGHRGWVSISGKCDATTTSKVKALAGVGGGSERTEGSNVPLSLCSPTPLVLFLIPAHIRAYFPGYHIHFSERRHLALASRRDTQKNLKALATPSINRSPPTPEKNSLMKDKRFPYLFLALARC